jgi:hypothetical protein
MLAIEIRSESTMELGSVCAIKVTTGILLTTLSSYRFWIPIPPAMDIGMAVLATEALPTALNWFRNHFASTVRYDHWYGKACD